MRFHFQSIFCASLLVVLASQGQSLVHSQDANKSVRIQFREASLEDRSSEDRTLEDLVSDSGPETIRYSEAQLTSENVQPTQAAPKRVTRLGMRDDANADTYNVSGRGVSKPEGKRTGRYCMNGMERAGFPWLPGSHARPGMDCYHSVGYVGGSTPFKSPWSGPLQGESRYRSEGTFGMDYSGYVFKRKTWLYWTHGSREQGGEGRYETEGPRILPEK